MSYPRLAAPLASRWLLLLPLLVLPSCGGGKPNLDGRWELESTEVPPQPTGDGLTDFLNLLGGPTATPHPVIEFDKQRIIIDGMVSEATIKIEDKRAYVTVHADMQGPEEKFAVDFITKDRITMPGPNGLATYNRAKRR
jgi:hypothetical protein